MKVKRRQRLRKINVILNIDFNKIEKVQISLDYHSLIRKILIIIREL